jgi:hypothetical protein
MIRVRTAVAALCVSAVISACSSNASKAKADSVAASDSVAVQDSIRAAIAHTNDSLAAAAGNAAANGAAPTTGTTGETRKVNDPATANPPAGIIGRDSAIGPVGSMDANGKVTKLKRKY